MLAIVSSIQKRKLSDMLGPQWSKEELDRFYEAYRKYGKDWKKVCHSFLFDSLVTVCFIFKCQLLFDLLKIYMYGGP